MEYVYAIRFGPYVKIGTTSNPPDERVIGEWYHWTPRMEAWTRDLPDSYTWPFLRRAEFKVTEQGELAEVVPPPVQF